VSELLRSELLKVITIRTFIWIALANAAIVFITALATAVTDDLSTANQDREAAHIAGVALLLALISGIVVMGGEARHGTITQTLLVAPSRERVVLAKAAVAALLGLILVVLAEALVLLLLVPDSLDVGPAAGALIGMLIAGPLAGVLGVGLAAILHAQGAAIGASLAWLLIGENLLVPAISDSAVKYTPGWTFGALASGVRDGGDHVLGMAGGGVGAAVWAALFVTAGLFALLGRDV
jgi:ABC-2 type transport system permease protein